MRALVWIGVLVLTSGAAACSRADGARGEAAPDSSVGATAAARGERSVAGTRTVPAGPAEGEATPPAPGGAVGGARQTVLFLGTSLTAGLGLDPGDAYPSLLQRKADSAGLSTEMVNAGLSGESSAGALRRVDWLLRGPADVVVIETGANDGLRGYNVDSTRANLERIIAKVKKARPAARILLVQMEAPPNLGPRYTSRFRAMFPEVARSTGVTLLPFLLEGVAGHAELNQADGIHPNVAGERIVAETVWRALRPVLADSAAGGG
jgi:acyl-CoA thioesterase-1